MKKQLLTLLLGVITFGAFAQVPSYIPTNGLVGFWPFDGNAQDLSGNSNHGTVNGATLTTDRNGNANKAYSFDGVNDNIFINKNFFNNGWSDFTVSILYYLNQQSNSNNGYSSNILFNTSPHHGIGFTMNWGNSNKYALFLADGNPATGWNGLHNSQSNQTISLNIWKHIVINKIAKKYYLYVDGNLDIIWDSPVLVQSYLSKLYFGACDPLNSNEVINGKLDDIAIFNRTLTQQEIIALYNGCTNPTATITAGGATTFCQGGSVTLTASSATNNTYQWYNNGNSISNATSSVYSATQSGNYTVKVTNGACNATSSATAVTVNSNPTVTLTGLNSVVYKTSLPVQLVGNPSGGTYTGETVSGSTFTPANATLGKKTIGYNYTTPQGCSGSASQTTIVADTVGNVCSTYDTLKIKVQFTAGLYANTTNTIKFFPNPTKDILFIDNGNYQAMNGYKIKIVTLAGAIVYNQPITSQQVQISMNQFGAKGIYIAQILDSNNTIVDSKKIVLE